MGRLDGKVVVVTGASRGIGADIARLFAAEGGRVICAARTLREGEHPLAGSLETTVAGIREEGGTAHAVTANIADPAECERLVEAAREIYGPVDVLVNNAALTYYVQIKDYPVGKWMRSWAVNFHAPFILSQLVLARHDPAQDRRHREHLLGLRDRSRPRAVSGPAVGARGGTCYGAEKAALERFTQGLASEVFQYGISVTSRRALAGRPHPRHRVPPARDRPRRPARRAPAPDGAGRAAAGHRADRAGQRPRDLQPADPPRVRLDRDARGRGVDTRGSGYSEI